MRTRDERRRPATRLWIPFSIYAAVTCLVPLLRRGDHQGAFLEHIAMTLLLPVGMLAAWAGLARAVRAARRPARRPPVR